MRGYGCTYFKRKKIIGKFLDSKVKAKQVS